MTIPNTGPSTPDYSANIRAQCARVRRSQREVARAADIPWSTWSARMQGMGSRAWRTTEVERIAAALDIPVEKLWGNES